MSLFCAAQYVRVRVRARKERTAEFEEVFRFQVFQPSLLIADIIPLSPFLLMAILRLGTVMTGLQMAISSTLVTIGILLGREERSKTTREALRSFSSAFRSLLSLKTAVLDIFVRSEILRFDIFVLGSYPLQCTSNYFVLRTVSLEISVFVHWNVLREAWWIRGGIGCLRRFKSWIWER